MSKVLPATCLNNQVKILDQNVDATILSQGKKSSTGVVLLDKGELTYVTGHALDVKELIESLVTILEKIVLITTGIDGASNSPGGQTANIAQLTVLKTTLSATKDNLR